MRKQIVLDSSTSVAVEAAAEALSLITYQYLHHKAGSATDLHYAATAVLPAVLVACYPLTASYFPLAHLHGSATIF